MKLFRLLKADEIECRVSRVTAKGVVLLLYKTARTDADLLDETFSPWGWQNGFQLIDGVLYGGIGIKDDSGNFLFKWDAGTESNTEAEKGRASDAFKRAGFKWGLGRELYSAPFVFIPAAKCNIKDGKCYDQFEVGAIGYDEQERINYLVITLKGETVFEWGEPTEKPKVVQMPEEKPKAKPHTNTDKVCSDCRRDIMMGVKKDGSIWKSDEIAAYSSRRYGRPLCVDCMKKVEYGDKTDG